MAKKSKTTEVPKPTFTEAELMYINRELTLGMQPHSVLDVELTVKMKLEAYAAAVRKRRNNIELKPAGQTDGEEKEGRTSGGVSRAPVP